MEYCAVADIFLALLVMAWFFDMLSVRKILSFRTFVVVSLLLFLATSFENTRLLAVNFHSGNPVLPSAFAGAVELGAIGLSVGMIVRRRNGQPARG